MRNADNQFRRSATSFAILRDENFRQYFIGQSLSALGDAVVPIALAFAVLNLTNSPAALGVVLLASRIPLTLTTLVGGVIGDRLPRRAIMIIADLARMLAHCTTAMLLISGRAHLWHLIVLQVIAGTASAFFNPAAAGLIRNVVLPEQLKDANALLGLSRNTTAIVAVVLSGIVVSTIGAGWSFMLNGLSFAFSVYYLGRIAMPPHERLQLKSNFVKQLADGYLDVAERRWLSTSIVYTALLNGFVIAPILVLGPTVAQKSLRGAASWAAIQAMTGIGAIIGSMIALRSKPRRPMASGIVVAFLIVPFAALLAFAMPTWLISIGGFLFGVQSSYFGVLYATTMQKAVAPDAVGRVTSYNSLGSLIMAPAGFGVAGIAAAKWGAEAVLLISASWCALSTAFVLSLPCVWGTDDALAHVAPKPPAALEADE